MQRRRITALGQPLVRRQLHTTRVPVTLGTLRSGNLLASLIACLRFSRLLNGSENGPSASWIVMWTSRLAEEDMTQERDIFQV